MNIFDYDRIHNMNPKELEQYLKGLVNRDTKKCSRCGRTPRYHIKVENISTSQTKRLCSVCDDCYLQLIKDMKTFDIIWK